MVARAFPYRMPRTPPFVTLSLKSIELMQIISSGASELDATERAVGEFFGAQLRSFLLAKRPKFKGRWEVSIRNSGSRFTYRWQVVGPSISSCDANGWEKFDIQISLTLGQAVILQAIDGFEAPGLLTRRPSDTRFKDNRLTDERLENIQSAFYDFLVRRGVGDGDSDSQSSIECSL
jgi:hypothetical protein